MRKNFTVIIMIMASRNYTGWAKKLDHVLKCITFFIKWQETRNIALSCDAKYVSISWTV